MTLLKTGATLLLLIALGTEAAFMIKRDEPAATQDAAGATPEESEAAGPDEQEGFFDIQVPTSANQGVIDTSNGVVDSSVYNNNNDEVYDATHGSFHILSRHENTEEAIAERNLAEVNKLSR